MSWQGDDFYISLTYEIGKEERDIYYHDVRHVLVKLS